MNARLNQASVLADHPKTSGLADRPDPSGLADRPDPSDRPDRPDPSDRPDTADLSKLADLADLILRLDRPGPRYTSYPPADRFTAAFSPAHAEDALRRADQSNAPLSVYIHMPHCARLCGYCACNVVPTKSVARRTSYVDLVLAELDLVRALMPNRRRLGQFHFGGGTPNSYAIADLTRLVAAVTEHFIPEPNAELAIEIDPRYATADQLTQLAAIGMNRLSFGVQDFDVDVQRAIGRHQSAQTTLAAVQFARNAGFASVNIDMVYGLPRQTLERFDQTITRLIETQPDRIALFSFAYLPEQRANQRGIDPAELASAPLKAQMLVLARERLTAAGYLTIGMDHFALPSDSLATAESSGRLRRNFQGYTVAPVGQSADAPLEVLGLGLSAVSDLGGAYFQNDKDVATYERSLAASTLPVERGHTASPDDLRRRHVIERIMTHVGLPPSEVDHLGVDLERDFPGAVPELVHLEDEGLVTLLRDGDHTIGVELTPIGALFPRRVAMCFDAKAVGPNAAASLARYSRIV
jgi:oxygen-independent coproporphyrinogen-3 oxidase